jgi:hypothetical protein
VAVNYNDSVAGNSQELKEYYTNEVVENEVLKEGALFGLMRKMTKFSGKTLPIPLVYGNPQGASANLATAIANKSQSSEASFALKRYRDYAVGSIEREFKLATEIDTDKGAWMEGAKIVIDGCLNTGARSQAISMYRDGTGVRGQISAGSNVGTTTVTLADINDISNFEVNMYIQLSATRGGGAVRSGQAQIASIDRSLGTLTFGGNVTSYISAAAAGDYICRAGDYSLVMPGLMSWLVPPSLRPSAAGTDNFYGQDRFPDKTRLMGIYHDGSNQPIEEVLIDLERKCARENARITHMFCNNVQYGQALKSLSSKVVFSPTTENARGANGPVATISFAGVKFQGAGGEVKIFPDFNCPSTKVFGLTLDKWTLYSLNPAPHIFDLDSDQEWLRESTADSYEVRVGSYSVVGCKAIGLNGFADVAAAT